MTRIRLVHIDPIDKAGDEWYVSELGHTIKREDFTSEIGNTYLGRWVLRSKDGTVIDHDQYRSDLMERNNFNSSAKRLAEILAEDFK